MKKKVFCVIPAWNEARTITKVVKNLEGIVDQVVVIDDASMDDTALLAKNAGAKVLRHLINRDQGAALQTGNDYALTAGADIIVHFDADDQFVASEIPELIKPILDDKADVVFGSRFLGKKSNLPFLKEKIIMPIARLVNKLFFDVKLSDPQSGFRAMNAFAAKKIKIEQDSKAHCSEIMHKVFREKLRVVEVPITVHYYEFGQRFSGGIRIVKDIILGKLIN